MKEDSTPDLFIKIRKVYIYPRKKKHQHSYLSGHLCHRILGDPDTLEGLVGLGSQVVLGNHSHLDPPSEGRHSQGDLEAQVLLTQRGGRSMLSVKDKGEYWWFGGFLGKAI